MIRSNCTYCFVFAQPDYESCYLAGRQLRMPPAGDGLLLSLAPGQCVYSAIPSPVPGGILMQVDFVAPARTARPDQFDQHARIAGLRLQEVPELVAALDAAQAPPKSPSSKTSAKPKPKLLRHALALLSAACAHPWFPVARLWEKIGSIPTPERQKKVRQQLADAGLATFTDLRIGSRKQGLITPTETGYAKVGVNAPTRTGRGGSEHTHMAAWVAMHARAQGLKAQLEYVIPGTNHPGDVAIFHADGQTEIVEISHTARDNLGAHIRACFEQSKAISRLTIVAAEKRILADLAKDLGGDAGLSSFMDRVKFQPIDHYMQGIF